MTAGTLLPVFALLGQMLVLGRRVAIPNALRSNASGAQAETNSEGDHPSGIPSREEMKRYLVWYSFYVNPQDPRGWVPKPVGYGWTVNFRTRRNVNIFMGLVAVSLVNAGLLALAAPGCS